MKISYVRYIFFTLLLLQVVACSKTPPEEAVLANIAFIQTAIEERNPGDVLAFLGDDLVANARMDKQDIKRLLLAQYLRHQHVNVVITKMEVEVNANIPFRAQSKGVVLLTGAQGFLPKEGRVYNVTGEWQQRDGDWVLIELLWK